METSILYPDHLEIISGIILLKDLKSLQILRASLICSGTVTVLSFNTNEDPTDYQLLYKSKDLDGSLLTMVQPEVIIMSRNANENVACISLNLNCLIMIKAADTFIYHVGLSSI